MILAKTKNWQVEQGQTGNYIVIYNFKGLGSCHLVSHHAIFRTIECSDDLTHIPESMKKVVSKWCANKATELLAENKVLIGVTHETNG